MHVEPGAILLAALFNPGDPSWQFWIGVISIAIPLLGVPTLGSIVLNTRRQRRKRLSYQVVSDVGLVNVQKDLGEDIQLTLDGHEVNNARLLVVKLANTGTELVKTEDFQDKEPIRIELDPPSLIRCAIHSTDPVNMIPQDRLKNYIKLDNNDSATHKYFELPGILLNPRESINLKLLTLGNVQMNVFAHLENGLVEQYTPPPQLITPRRIVAALAIAFLIGLLISNGIGLIGAFVQGRCAIGFPINVSGSSAFQATAKAEAEQYRTACPVAVFSDIGSSSSGAGLQDLENNKIQIANSELSLKDAGDAYTDLSENQVAVIVFTLVVNKNVTGVSTLSRSQITDIYNGTIKNWQRVGGPDRPIVLVGRPTDSGTHAAFAHFVLTSSEAPVSLVETRTQEVISTVSTRDGAIGYVDLGSANQANAAVTSIAIDGNAPTAGLVASNSYPFWAIERMYTKKNPDAISHSFINYIINDIRTSDTFLRLKDMRPGVLLMHE